MELLEISEDALKAMVAENGVRGTARMLGMNTQQADAFRQRVCRAKWMSDPAIAAARAKLSPTSPYAPVVAKLSPAQAIASELQQLGGKTRLSLARGIAKAGEHVEKLQGAEIIQDAQNIKAIAQTANTIHNWTENSPQVKIRLDLLAAQNERPVIDVESSTVTDMESEHNELDDY